jgi:hypothetical protein
MEIRSVFWLPAITDWWHQQEESHSNHADLSNAARNIFSIIPHCVAVEASFSPGRDNIGWTQSNTSSKFLHETVIIRQFVFAICWIAVADDPPMNIMDSGNIFELKTGRGKRIVQNDQDPRLLGDVAEEPNSMCYTEGITYSSQANDSYGILFRY